MKSKLEVSNPRPLRSQEGDLDAALGSSAELLLREQGPRIDTEEVGDLLQCLEGEIPLAPFDRAEVRPVNAHPLRERLLAEALLLTMATQVSTHDALKLALHSDVYAAAPLLEGLQTYK